jgi:hypothetical protein
MLIARQQIMPDFAYVVLVTKATLMITLLVVDLNLFHVLLTATVLQIPTVTVEFVDVSIACNFIHKNTRDRNPFQNLGFQGTGSGTFFFRNLGFQRTGSGTLFTNLGVQGTGSGNFFFFKFTVPSRTGSKNPTKSRVL